MNAREFRPEAYFLRSTRDDAIEHFLSFENTDIVLCRLAGRTHVDARQLGLGFVHEADGRINTTFLYAENFQSASECVLELPFGLEFGLTRAEVREVMGSPVESGGGSTSQGCERAKEWDAYLVDEVRIHFEFSLDDSGIDLVTLQCA